MKYPALPFILDPHSWVNGANAIKKATKAIIALMFLLLLVPSANAQGLYGATLTNIVKIDPSNPSVITVVGAHHLPVATTYITLTYNRSDNYLYGIVQSIVSEALYRFDYQTGQSTFLTNLNIADNFETIEYVDTLKSLVVSHGGNPSTQLAKLSNSGILTPLVNNGLDNDAGAYDPVRNLFYTSDAQGANNIVRTSLSSVASSALGGVPSRIGDLAFSTKDDAIFALDASNTNFYRINTTSGSGPITVTTVGTLTGDKISGIAFVAPAPEPASLALLLPMITGIVMWRWIRSSAKSEAFAKSGIPILASFAVLIRPDYQLALICAAVR